jgi:hypothetical protein
MSNHYHVVLHIDAEQAKQWPIDEVIERWHRLFKGTPLTQLYQRSPHELDAIQRQAVADKAEDWRCRLMDISWFMRIVNEGIARQANAEDQCTGRFWEGRFKCQALLDEQALAACMAYVDLNPIRAKLADKPEFSDHTSIKKRCKQAVKVTNPNGINEQPKQIMPFAGHPRKNMPKGLPFYLTDYLEFVDWTGRTLREDKRGAIAQAYPPILDRVAIEPSHFACLATHFESRFKTLVGTALQIKNAASQMGYQRLPSGKQSIVLTT